MKAKNIIFQLYGCIQSNGEDIKGMQFVVKICCITSYICCFIDE